MLLEFNFENFKSFRDKVTLDLTATKITELSENVVTLSNEKVLRTAAIYGANASGKSNVYEAFETMTFYTTLSFGFGGDSKSKNSAEPKLLYKPFKFDYSTQNKETTFEVFFISNDDPKERTYQYGFSIKDGIVVEEWLYRKFKTAKEFKTVLYRKGTVIELHGIPKRSQENIRVALEDQALILSLGAKLRIPELSLVYSWFNDNEVVDFGNRHSSYYRSGMLPDGFVDDVVVQSEVVDYFSSFQEGIQSFLVREAAEKDTYQIDSFHKMVDSEELTSIPLITESSGTLRMFSLYQPLKNVLNDGGVLFIDELNSKLHPLLVRNIILTFQNPEVNKKNAQLIFTTHDIWQLSGDHLRRDEIWFVNKDENGISTLYSLADIVDENGDKIRKDENFQKNYVFGKYDAIPSLKPMRGLVEE